MVVNLLNKEPEENASKSHLRLWIQLLRVSRSIEAEIRDRLRREFNETLPRFDVMAALYRKPEGMMMSELSRFLMVSNGNVTGIVDRLVKDGLALRSQRDGNRRSWFICLTKTGTQNFEKMALAHENWISQLLQSCDGDEIEILRAGLSRLNKDWQGNHE
ncbi:MAG: MarR family transcriptional regulator [Rhizobiaceae bacterium]|nr:MarR family transcriptional regulator [Rhizobiaceae bacterium]